MNDRRKPSSNVSSRQSGGYCCATAARCRAGCDCYLEVVAGIAAIGDAIGPAAAWRPGWRNRHHWGGHKRRSVRGRVHAVCGRSMAQTVGSMKSTSPASQCSSRRRRQGRACRFPARICWAVYPHKTVTSTLGWLFAKAARAESTAFPYSSGMPMRTGPSSGLRRIAAVNVHQSDNAARRRSCRRWWHATRPRVRRTDVFFHCFTCRLTAGARARIFCSARDVSGVGDHEIRSKSLSRGICTHPAIKFSMAAIVTIRLVMPNGGSHLLRSKGAERPGCVMRARPGARAAAVRLIDIATARRGKAKRSLASGRQPVS